jgi:hypothetical protein
MHGGRDDKIWTKNEYLKADNLWTLYSSSSSLITYLFVHCKQVSILIYDQDKAKIIDDINRIYDNKQLISNPGDSLPLYNKLVRKDENMAV